MLRLIDRGQRPRLRSDGAVKLGHQGLANMRNARPAIGGDHDASTAAPEPGRGSTSGCRPVDEPTGAQRTMTERASTPSKPADRSSWSTTTRSSARACRDARPPAGVPGRRRGRHGRRGHRAARRFQPDLVVMDVRLPDGSGIEACREIRAELPETRVVMLTSYPDEEAVIAAIVAGASGYLLKQVRARDLVAALEAVGRGESLLDPAVTGKVLERMRRIATSDRARRARRS